MPGEAYGSPTHAGPRRARGGRCGFIRGLSKDGVSCGTGRAFARFPVMPSTAISRFAFHPAEAALDIEFASGRVYRYYAVPEEVARAFAGARSKGIYFNHAIRDRFRYARLRGGWEPPGEEDPVHA